MNRTSFLCFKVLELSLYMYDLRKLILTHNSSLTPPLYQAREVMYMCVSGVLFNSSTVPGQGSNV